jgi:hypothetical protein
MATQDLGDAYHGAGEAAAAGAHAGATIAAQAHMMAAALAGDDTAGGADGFDVKDTEDIFALFVYVSGGRARWSGSGRAGRGGRRAICDGLSTGRRTN